MTENERKTIILKATVEISPLYKYKIKNSALGAALLVDASTKEKASVARKVTPATFEGLRTIVIYSTYKEEKEPDKN